MPGGDKGVRLHSLDSLRGVAALVVVVHHCVLTLPGGIEDRAALAANGLGAPFGWLYLTPLRLLVAGPAAVYVFFVLSGLVLALTFVSRDGDRYPPYLVKRITRIWIPFAAAILVSDLLLHLFGHARVPGTSDWFDFTWSQWPNPPTLLAHLLMSGSTISLDNPMWSLVHELRISVIFPLLVFACRASWRGTLAGTVVLGAVASRLMAAAPASITYASVLQTCTYLFMFVLGIGLAQHMRALRHRVEQLSAGHRAWLWLVALAGLSFVAPNPMAVTAWRDIALTWANAGAAALLVLLCLAEGRASRMLTGPVPMLLGRVSYSLYLTHVIVLVTVVRLLAPLAPLPLCLAAALAAALIVAVLFWRLVESPSGQFGRRLARHLARRRVVA